MEFAKMKVFASTAYFFFCITIPSVSGETTENQLISIENNDQTNPLNLSLILKREKNLKFVSNTTMDLPVQGDCSSFYRCFMDTDNCTVNRCPSGLYFDPLLRTCNWSPNVKCFDLLDNTSFVCPRENGDFEFPGFCNVYWRCRKGEREIVHCPGNMHWNADLSLCQPPDEAGCQLQCGPEGDFQPISGTCSKFLHCEDGMSHVFECPKFLRIDKRNKLCTYPAKSHCSKCLEENGMFVDYKDNRSFVECKDSKVRRRVRCPEGMTLNHRTGECQSESSKECPNEVACPTADGIFPDYCFGYCSRYVICSSGIPDIHTCPTGLFYDPYSEVCDAPEKSACLQKCPEKDGIYPYKDFFGAYMVCKDGEPRVEICPEGLVYSFALKKCHTPEKEHKECDLLCDRDPIPGFCDQYIECDCRRGILVRHKCSKGLHYNSITKQCDWPDNVACRETTPENEICPPDHRYNAAIQECEEKSVVKYENLCTKYPGQILPIPGSCDILFRCYPEEIQMIQGARPGDYTSCSHGLRYNFSIGACDLKKNVQCIDYWDVFSKSLVDDINLKDVLHYIHPDV